METYEHSKSMLKSKLRRNFFTKTGLMLAVGLIVAALLLSLLIAMQVIESDLLNHSGLLVASLFAGLFIGLFCLILSMHSLFRE